MLFRVRIKSRSFSYGQTSRVFALKSCVNLAEPRIDTRNEIDRELNDTKAGAVDDQETIDGIVNITRKAVAVPDQRTMGTWLPIFLSNC